MRTFAKTFSGIFILSGCIVLLQACATNHYGLSAEMKTQHKQLSVALIQFDAVPENPNRNLQELERLARSAAGQGARLIMFHEGCIADYTPNLEQLSEPVPNGNACKKIAALAEELDSFISFGLSECEDGRFYITQVFVGPDDFFYRYRKSWLWREPTDTGYRNEWARYDTGDGPILFEIDGIKATCFICADGEAPRCIQRAKELRPELVFYPNNRGGLPDFPVFGERAAEIGAPMLVTNRVGKSWVYDCKGGCVVYDSNGEVLAKANRDGTEEILLYKLTIPVR